MGGKGGEEIFVSLTICLAFFSSVHMAGIGSFASFGGIFE